jgi:hypothetical protein
MYVCIYTYMVLLKTVLCVRVVNQHYLNFRKLEMLMRPGKK